MKISFKDIPDSNADFGTLPLGKYPARLKVDGYQHDEQGNFALDGAGNKVYWTTNAGDPKWNLTFEILNLDGNRRILDNLNFSQGGRKRVKVLYVRGGFAEGDEEEIDIEPDDLDGTYWWIDVDEHQVRADRGGAVKESKYTFKARDCRCDVCRAYDGQKVNVDARIGFAGFSLMDPKDVAKFTGTNGKVDPVSPALRAAGVQTLCPACTKGEHWHKQGANDNCPCDQEGHTPF